MKFLDILNYNLSTDRTMFKEFLREHQHEFIVFGIMAAVSFVIGLAITGDYSDALARSKR